MQIQSFVRPEDMEVNPCKYLAEHDSEHPAVQYFADVYLRPVLHQRKNGMVEITNIGFEPAHIWYLLLGVKPPKSTLVDDPIPLLDRLLRHAMKTGQADFVLDSRVVLGFSGCGRGFYSAFTWSFQKGKLLSPDITYPLHLVVETAHGSYWTRPVETSSEQLYNFIYSVRTLATCLAAEPLGKKSTLSASDAALALTSLKRRHAYVHAGDQVSLIYTYDTPPTLQGPALAERWATLQQQTRERYCTRAEIEPAQQANPSPSQPPQPKPRWKVSE